MLARHVVIVKPLDHAHAYLPMRTVGFVLHDRPTGRDEAMAELYEEWLEPVTLGG